jgi:plasmid stabilization system protein ParE
MVKLKIEWLNEARLDLFEILEFYYARNGNVTYSKKLSRLILNSLKLISKTPEIGRNTNFTNVKAYIKKDYEILYEILDSSILVTMIWDSRRNPLKKIINRK